jgi:hypothetical protein
VVEEVVADLAAVDLEEEDSAVAEEAVSVDLVAEVVVVAEPAEAGDEKLLAAGYKLQAGSP